MEEWWKVVSSGEKKRKLVKVNINKEKIKSMSKNGGGTITSTLSYIVSAQMR